MVDVNTWKRWEQASTLSPFNRTCYNKCKESKAIFGVVNFKQDMCVLGFRFVIVNALISYDPTILD